MRSALWYLPFVILVVSLSGCGWQEKLEFVSPHSSARVTILQPFPINEAAVKVILSQNGSKTELFYRRADTFLEFADAWWAPDGSTVAVYLCGITGIAYDLKGRKPLPFSTVRSNIAEHIRAQYHLSNADKDDDATLSWACSEEARRMFLTRYPKAKAF